MQAAGIIERHTAILNPDTLGLGMTFFTRVLLTGQDETTVERFTKELQRLRNVVECRLMAGDCDFLLRTLAADITAYRRFQSEYLNALPGVQSVKTEIPMQRIKYSNEMPI
jgi:DNA-binding Lrp family transcriptional regulator